MTKAETAMLATLEANQLNIQQALLAHQEFTATKFEELTKVLNRIEIQTVKTNGRTTENEKSIYGIKSTLKPILDWKAKLGGIWFTIVILGSLIGGLSGLILGIMSVIHK